MDKKDLKKEINVGNILTSRSFKNLIGICIVFVAVVIGIFEPIYSLKSDNALTRQEITYLKTNHLGHMEEDIDQMNKRVDNLESVQQEIKVIQERILTILENN